MRDILVWSAIVGAAQAGGWSYGEPGKWKDVEGSSCGGKSNSPINVVSAGLEKASVDTELEALDFARNVISAKAFSAKMDNVTKGHALKFNLNPEVSNDKVSCPQFHFHFVNSEHTLDGKHKFGEVHMVCYKKRNADLNAAIKEGKGDSLAVFGFWLDVDGHAEENAEVKTLIDLVKDSAGGTDAQIKFPAPVLSANSAYYRYMGGLTTPGCNEIVQWTLFADAVKITQAQADAIKLWPHEITGNNRPVQALNKRTVTVIQVEQPTGMPTSAMIAIIIGFLLVLGAIVFFLKSRSKKEPAHPEAQSLK